ncbi:hypothetical protein D3C81_1270880 [compost metagenome]
MVVDNLRIPARVHRQIQIARFLQRRHVEVAIVVVPGVLLVKTRWLVEHPLGRHRLTHVPIRIQLLAVGIGVHQQHDGVVENAPCFSIIAARQLPHRFDQLMRADGFIGMQATIDPHHRLASRGQCTRRRIAVARTRQTLGDAAVFLQPRQVGRRRCDQHQLRAPFGRPAKLHQPETVRRSSDAAEVRLGLRVVGEHVVIADIKTKMRLWRRRRRVQRARPQRDHQQRASALPQHVHLNHSPLPCLVERPHAATKCESSTHRPPTHDTH